MNTNFDPSSRQPKGPFAQALTLIIGVIVLGLSLMFSLVVFAVIAVLGLVVGVYFWWKTRAIRTQLRQQMQEPMRGQGGPRTEVPEPGDVIEGEAVRVDETGREAGEKTDLRP